MPSPESEMLPEPPRERAPDLAPDAAPGPESPSAGVAAGAGAGAAASAAARADRSSIDLAKAAARSRLRAARRQLTADQVAARGQALARVLPSVVPAGSAVAGYMPMPGEPDVRPFLTEHAADGGAVYVPVIASPQSRVLEWVRWTPDAQLQRSAFAAIDEPHGDRLSTVALRELHPEGLTVLVPGLAVDHDGARMGQGGGFYDTAFGASPDQGTSTRAATETRDSSPRDPHSRDPRRRDSRRFIAVVHAAEVLSPGTFPVEAHDLRVHGIVTELGATTLRAL